MPGLRTRQRQRGFLDSLWVSDHFTQVQKQRATEMLRAVAEADGEVEDALTELSSHPAATPSASPRSLDTATAPPFAGSLALNRPRHA